MFHEDHAVDTSANFVKFGGDSLSALQFVTRVETVFSGLTLPGLLDVTLHGTLRDVLDYLKREKSPVCQGNGRTISQQTNESFPGNNDHMTKPGCSRTKDSLQELNTRKRRLSNKDSLEIEEQCIKCRCKVECTTRDLTDSDCGKAIKKRQTSTNDLRAFVCSVERGNRTHTHISPSISCTSTIVRGEDISEDTLCTSTVVRGKHISEDTQEVTPGLETNMATVIHPEERHCCESHQPLPDDKATGLCRLDIVRTQRHDTGKCVDASPLVATRR